MKNPEQICGTEAEGNKLYIVTGDADSVAVYAVDESEAIQIAKHKARLNIGKSVKVTEGDAEALRQEVRKKQKSLQKTRLQEMKPENYSAGYPRNYS